MNDNIDGADEILGQIKEYYVYELFDRRDGVVFYVGEGVRERGLQHFREADKIKETLEGLPGERINEAKVDRIRSIRSAGDECLGIRVVGRFDSKHEAQAVEAILINWIYGIENLTNISKGRGNAHMRPRSRHLDDLPGIDIPKRLVVQGQTAGASGEGYLSEIIEKHEKYNHFSMAEDIAQSLNEAGVMPPVGEPCYWEAGRYIALFVTLVPGAVRMIVQLTDSAKHKHVYNIIPMSNRKADREAFVQYMNANHSDVELKKGGLYCKLPGWENLKVKNENLPEILAQVRYAQRYFGAPEPSGCAE